MFISSIVPHAKPMARQRYLSKAPIREAVLDLSIPTADRTLLTEFRRILDDGATGEFTDVHEMRRGEFVVEFSPEGDAKSRSEASEPIGVRGTSYDGLWVAQLKIDGVTFSRLPSYTNWEDLSTHARPVVERFLNVVAPKYVSRVALRYINHFRLPYPIELSDYFRGLPEIPDELPQFTSNLLVRHTIHDPERDFSCHITQALLDDLDPEQMGFILDIDAFRTADLPARIDSLWKTFEELRVFKNKIFFELITERNAESHQ